jgi:hypothetical protein
MNRLFLLAAAPTDDGLVIREIWLLRLRALLARAHGDEAAYRKHRDRYREYRDRYSEMATSLGYEGHIKWGRGLITKRTLIVGACGGSGERDNGERRQSPWSVLSEV